MSELMTLGVLGQSQKENERRVPIHPDHFALIPQRLRTRVMFEEGYGARFGIGDAELASLSGGVAPRGELLRDCAGALLLKPLPPDLEELREGGVLWGWPHCVQQADVTRIAVERRLTLIAFESMFRWKSGQRDMHLFYRNNEMAGYCAVHHALSLTGRDGTYGPPAKTVVLSFGSVSRGAVYALRGRGFGDVRVYTQRPPLDVRDQVPGCRYGQVVVESDGSTTAIESDGARRPLVEVLAEADLIVNGILQDTDRPLMFLQSGDERRLKRGTLIVDVSCDSGMGFPFARPTSFAEPTFAVGDTTYYAVDHTPSYLWRSASWEISNVVVSMLEDVMRGPQGWNANETIRRAVEIQDGVVRNPKIVRFQERAGIAG